MHFVHCSSIRLFICVFVTLTITLRTSFIDSKGAFDSIPRWPRSNVCGFWKLFDGRYRHKHRSNPGRIHLTGEIRLTRGQIHGSWTPFQHFRSGPLDSLCTFALCSLHWLSIIRWGMIGGTSGSDLMRKSPLNRCNPYYWERQLTRICLLSWKATP